MSYLRPTTLADAAAARAEHPDYTVLAGGTDLLVAANQKPDPVGVIDLFGLGDIRGISEQPGGSLRLGAATTYADILRSPLVADRLPMLREACREIGALQIQARGTLGGNLGTSSPVGDTLPVWLAADASIELVSVRGSRAVPYDQYCTGYRKTVREPDELIAAVIVPPLGSSAVQHWRKVGTRRAQSISKVMIAATGRVEQGRIAAIRIGLGAVADRPVRARAAEAAAMGKAPGDETAQAVRLAVRSEIKPIDDVRSTASYRLRVAENLAARFVANLAG